MKYAVTGPSPVAVNEYVVELYVPMFGYGIGSGSALALSAPQSPRTPAKPRRELFIYSSQIVVFVGGPHLPANVVPKAKSNRTGRRSPSVEIPCGLILSSFSHSRKRRTVNVSDADFRRTKASLHKPRER